MTVDVRVTITPTDMSTEDLCRLAEACMAESVDATS